MLTRKSKRSGTEAVNKVIVQDRRIRPGEKMRARYSQTDRQFEWKLTEPACWKMCIQNNLSKHKEQSPQSGNQEYIHEKLAEIKANKFPNGHMANRCSRMESQTSKCKRSQSNRNQTVSRSTAGPPANRALGCTATRYFRFSSTFTNCQKFEIKNDSK